MLGILSFMSPLTHRQEEVLFFIKQFSLANGFSPTIREIGGHFHIAPSSTLEHLKALEKKRCIKRHPLKSRCLEILTGRDEVSNE